MRLITPDCLLFQSAKLFGLLLIRINKYDMDNKSSYDTSVKTLDNFSWLIIAKCTLPIFLIGSIAEMNVIKLL